MTVPEHKPVRWFRRAIGAMAAIGLVLFALHAAPNMGWLGNVLFGKIDSLRLGAYEGDVGALEWIAHDRGHYNNAGLAVAMQAYSSGRDAMEALRAGEIDVATASEYVVATRSFAEGNLRILGSIAYYRNKGIVARRDRGIQVAGDLKGKRIGVTSPSGAEYSLSIFLALHGLSLANVTVVNLSPELLVEELGNGSIDAAITWQPHVRAIEEKLGDNGVTFSGDGFDTYLLLVTRQEMLTTQAGSLKKLMRGLVAAQGWVESNPAAARQYLGTRFKLDPAYVEALWPKMTLEVTLPQGLLVALDAEARWLARKGSAANKTIPNYSDFIRADELRAVKPTAVTLYAERASSVKSGSGR